MKNTENRIAERRSEKRRMLEQYRSVEFSLSRRDPVFQFRIRDKSPSGMGILLNEGSNLLKHLKVGQVFDMKYNSKNPNCSPENIKTKIGHITHLVEGRYKGHYLVGLSIIKS